MTFENLQKMAAELNFEDFLNSLPGLITQAKRNLFTYNENLLEYWTRRLEDCLNVLNVAFQRISNNRGLQEERDGENNNMEHYLHLIIQDIQNTLAIFNENLEAAQTIALS